MNAISPDAENVRRALVAKGIETPMIDPTQCKDERRAAIASHMREVMKLIGLDLHDDSLEETQIASQKCLLMKFSVEWIMPISRK